MGNLSIIDEANLQDKLFLKAKQLGYTGWSKEVNCNELSYSAGVPCYIWLLFIAGKANWVGKLNTVDLHYLEGQPVLQKRDKKIS
jgi:hypothetical protein